MNRYLLSLLLLAACNGSEDPSHEREAELGARTRASLRAESKPSFDRLSERAPVHTRLSPNGLVANLSGRQLLSPECKSRSERHARYGADWIRTAVDCFFGENHSLFLENGEGLDFAFLEIEDSAPGPDEGELFVILRQYHQKERVHPAQIHLFFSGGELLHVTGRMFDPRTFTKPDRLARSNVLREASQRIDRELTFFDEYYDAERQRFVIEGREGEVAHLLDASTGKSLGSRSLAHGLVGPGMIPKTVPAYRYPDGSTLVGSPTINSAPVNPISASRQVFRSCVNPIMGVCADNAQCDFTPGFPTYTTFTDPAGQAHAPNDLPSSLFFQGNGGPETRIVARTTCTNTEPFNNTGSFTWPNLQWIAMSDYHWISRVASMKNHWTSYLDQGVYNQPLPLQLKVQGTTTGGGGVYTSFDSRISLEWFAQNTFASILSVLAHEYGHHVNHGFSCTAQDQQNRNAGCGFNGTAAVREGWADTFALRFALFGKVGSNEFPTANYNWNIWAGRPYQHSGPISKGEFTVAMTPTTNGATSNFSDAFYSTNANCANENAGGGYNCGTVISQVYWELVWNVCKTSYFGCSSGSQVVTNSIWDSWMLANSAFAYAMAMTAIGADVGDFLFNANTRYGHFFSTNHYIDSASYGRVTSVFEHHCSGIWESECLNYKNPGSPYSVSFSTKAAGYSEVELWTKAGGATVTSAPNAAANAQFVNLPVNGSITTSPPLNGPRRLHLIVRTSASTATAGSLSITDRNGARSLPLTFPTSWAWLPASGFLIDVAVGGTVRVQNTSAIPVQIDAAWVE